MNKIKNIDSKTAYVSPSMKQVMLGARTSLLTGSYGDPGKAGLQGIYYNDSEEVDY